MDDTQCLTDIDATQCESLDVVEAVDENILSQKCSYNFNSENQSVTSNKEQEADKLTGLVADFEKTNVKNVETSKNVECHSSKSNVSQIISKENYLNLENRTKNVENKTQSLKNYTHTKDFQNIYKNVADIFNNKKIGNIRDNAREKSSDNTKTLNKLKDVENSQDVNAQLVNKHNTEYFTCKTHYSQSQINAIIPIEAKYIYGTKRNNYKQNKDVNENKKKKTEDDIVSKDEFIQNSKKIFTNTKDISNDDMYLPEIHLTKVSTEKPVIAQKLKTDNEKVPNEADSKIIHNDTIQQELQTTNFSSQTYYSNPIITQNDNETFVNIQDNNAISNAVYTNNYTQNANNSMLYNNESMLNVNAISLEANELNETIQNLDSIINVNAKNQNAESKVKHIAKDLFFDESQVTNFSYSTDTFQNYISDDSLGFSHNFGAKNYRTGKETTNKSCAVFDKTLDSTLTDELRTNFSNSQITKAVNNKGNNIPENKKSYTNFDKFNSAESAEHIDELKNQQAESCTNSYDNLEELADSETEKIPFKIIEELNKVKLFLNKRNDKNFNSKGYSSDTGYRSDCSSRNSLKCKFLKHITSCITFPNNPALSCNVSVSQTSSSGLDQSAHSLYSYISECPLVSSMEDITEEISVVSIETSHSPRTVT